MDDQSVVVRGVRVPAAQIKELEDKFGASLVPDSEWLIIKALDLALKRYRAEHGRDPELMNLREDIFSWYKHAPLSIEDPVFHALLPARTKPAWFRLPRIYRGASLVRN